MQKPGFLKKPGFWLNLLDDRKTNATTEIGAALVPPF
jgi:hypothetical protein